MSHARDGDLLCSSSTRTPTSRLSAAPCRSDPRGRRRRRRARGVAASRPDPVEDFGETAVGGGLHEGPRILSGRIGATPYAVFGGAMVVLGTIVALLLLLAAFIVWV